MGLGLGLASSHAPSMFLPAEKWPPFYATLIRGLPQPPQAADENLPVIEGFCRRIDRAFALLARHLEQYRPDALIVVGDDQGEVFSPSLMPNLALFTGDEVSGTLNVEALGDPIAENHVTFSGAPGIATRLVEALVRRGFDFAVSQTLQPLGKPDGGLGHAFTRPGQALNLSGLKIPMIPLFLNAYHPPLLSAERCLELGRAIAEVSRGFPERLAIYGSGGMSHDPRGPRAGWVDEPLDRWVLQQLKDGTTDTLRHLFTFDSDTLRSGTGEIRSWLVVAGAFSHHPAEIVDYFAAHHAVTGIGFALWPEMRDK